MPIARRLMDDHNIGSPSYGSRPSAPPPSFQRARVHGAITDLDRRVVQINQRLDAIGAGSWEANELADERATLRHHRTRLQAELAALDRPREMTDAEIAKLERYERRVANEVANRRESVEHFIRKLEAAGEWQQVKIWRLAMLTIDSEVRRELGPP